MPTEMRRTMLSIPKEFEAGLFSLKKNKFYNSTQSEMLRHLIYLGLKAEGIKITDEAFNQSSQFRQSGSGGE